MLYMKNLKSLDSKKYMHWLCIIFIWAIYVYSTIVQYKFFTIPNGMLFFGTVILLAFLILINGKKMSITSLFPRECICMLLYLLYMFLFGLISSPNRIAHINDCITYFEYLFIMFVIEYLIVDISTDSFQALLLVTALFLGIVLIRDPILYTTGRYSISIQLNPNYLGMCLTAGVWAVLYYQQKRKIPLLVMFVIICLLEYCILQTGSRKALIASVIIMGLWLLFCFFPNIKDETIFKKIMYIILLGISMYLFIRFFLSAYSESVLVERMNDLQSETMSGERIGLYKIGLQLFREHPFFGIGFSGYRTIIGEHSHATFVEVPVSGGIFGSLIYFATYVISIKKCIYIYRVSRKDPSLTEAFFEVKMLLVLWVSMIFYCTCVIHPSQFLSYLVFGIIFGKTAYLEKLIGTDNKNTVFKKLSRKNGNSVYFKN